MAPDFKRSLGYHGPSACCASSGTRTLSSALACSCSRCADLVPGEDPAYSAQALETLISTIRIASIRGFGGSTPKRVGGSPLSTQDKISARR